MNGDKNLGINSGNRCMAAAVSACRIALALYLASVSLQTGQAGDPLTYFSGRHRIRPACNVPPGEYQYLPRTPSVSVGSLPALPRHSSESMERAIQAARNPVPQTSLINPLVNPNPVLGGIGNPGNITTPDGGLIPDPRNLPNMLNQFGQNPWTPLMQPPSWMIPNANFANVPNPNAVGRPAIPNTPVVKPYTKTLQMAVPVLDVAHCRINGASVVIDPQGNWTVSFKAEQNPLLDRDTLVRNLDLQLKRNLFVMEVRLTDSAVSGRSSLPGAGQTLPTVGNHRSTGLVQIQIPRISIQRESSEFLTFHGNDPKIAQHFEQIQGAEFQFHALLDPLAGSGQGVVMPWQNPYGKK